MGQREIHDLPVGRLVAIGLGGLILASACAFLGYLLAPQDAFFGERNSGLTRAVGMAALLAGSLALAAVPLYAAWIRQSATMLCVAVVIAGSAFLAVCAAAT